VVVGVAALTRMKTLREIPHPTRQPRQQRVAKESNHCSTTSTAGGESEWALFVCVPTLTLAASGDRE